jgi:hypothetical protein
VKRARSRSPIVRFALLVAIGACSKGSSQDGAAPVASGASSASPALRASSSASPSASQAVNPTEHAAWSGSYTAKVGAVEPPKNANEKTWTNDPGSAAVGKGAIDLTVGDKGETRGETKGPLGDMTISGVYDGKELRANLAPKEPKSDGAMTGFMVLAAEGDALKGTLRVSSRDAKIVREATVELAKK